MRTLPQVLLLFALLGCASFARAADREGDSIAAAEARLERIRGDPAAASDPKEIDELAHHIEKLQPGMLRVEARMLIAEAWLRRMHRPGEAVDMLRNVVTDPSADSLTSAVAEHEIVEALVNGGKLAEAAAEAHAKAGLLDATFVRRVGRLVRRIWFARLAAAVLLAFGALAAAALWRAQRRGLLRDAKRALVALAPVALAFVAFVALGGGALASRYESGNALPFLLLGAASWPLVILARAWSAVGSPRPALRVGRALLCGATLVAAAFLLLDRVSPDYLEGFGL
jgi:hypothetical protein